ncbi:hypothetical protein RHSIM_RhsimUnG0020100 [Rhododendron simsii]|uniref:Uncharacterized protein n=1 Tax=Rhododendron simsii TaxID=118357 RepID=A0A834L337_RHOSS|nr:hypothetical protein RHSIM_RhsimUnG0020100 [Rhododendron simsii]
MRLFSSNGACYAFSWRSTAEEGIHGTGLSLPLLQCIVLNPEFLAYAYHAAVVAAASTEVKEAIVKEIPTAKIEAMGLNLNLLASVRKLASKFNSLGFPRNLLMVFFLTAHFLLTDLMLETMKKMARRTSKEGRIANASSRQYHYSFPEGIRLDKINGQSGKYFIFFEGFIEFQRASESYRSCCYVCTNRRIRVGQVAEPDEHRLRVGSGQPLREEPG